jgi:glycerol-3-phosphate O-acyltransferase
MQTILALSNKGKIEQLKQIAELPWEGKSPFVRVAALRSLWHLTSAHEYREAYIALRKRVQHSLIQQLGQTRADYLMRGLFTENFRKSLQGTLDAHYSGEKTKSKSS